MKFNAHCSLYITGEIVTSAPSPVTAGNIQITTMKSTASTNGIEYYVSHWNSILFNTFKYIIYTIQIILSSVKCIDDSWKLIAIFLYIYICTSYLFREHKLHLWCLFMDGLLFTNGYISTHHCFISSFFVIIH